jgi:hypothetical protein
LKLLINDKEKDDQSRVTFIRLVSLQLRLIELWTESSGGFQEALVQLAISAIIGDRFTRGAPEMGLRNMLNPVPPALFKTRCNLSSIAAGSGLNRETVRRIVNRLIKEGRLIRLADNSINFAPGRAQSSMVQRLGQQQLEEFCRTANLLLRDRLLYCEEDSMSAV